MASDAAHLLTNYLHHLSSAARVENLPDRALIERFVSQRDEDAFAALVRRHGPMVLRVCQRVLHDVHAAEDAFQATFLVLSRKAASLRCADTVGCFLHGVAFRVAQNARKQRVRRQKHESQNVAKNRATDPLAEVSVREAQAILDQELACLPEKYRAPLVLCCLEGKTRDEAAWQLGWPVKLVKSRLEDGRERLRSRLTRRGLTLPAALVATLLAEEAAPAAVPMVLIRAALQAVLTSNSVSASVALLAESALGGTAIGKAKVVIVTLMLLTGALAAGMGAFAPPQPAEKQIEPPAAARATEPAIAKEQRPPRTDRFGDLLPAGAVARIGSVRWWCGRGHCPLVYATDGKSLILREARGTVRILDTATGKELRRIDVPVDRSEAHFALAPNGKTLVTADFRSPLIRIWDVPSGKELRRVEGDKTGIDAVAFSPNGKTFAAGMRTGIRLWNTDTWKEMSRITAKEAAYYNGIFFLPDGKTIISGNRVSISWWDRGAGRETRQINRDKYGKGGGAFYSLAVSPDGKRVAAFYSSDRTGMLLLLDASTGNEIRRIELGPHFRGGCLCFSPDGQTLACGNGVGRWGNQTLFFAAATGEELRRWDEGNDFTMQLAFSPDGKILAQAKSNVIRLRDAATGRAIVPDLGLPNYCMAVRFSRDGKALITGCHGGRTGSWNPLTGEPLTPLRDPPDGFGQRADMLLGPALTTHGERAALVNSKGVLHVWEPATGNVWCRIAEPPVGDDQADFSTDQNVVAVKHTDHLIRLWDTRTGKLLRSLPRPGFRFPHPHAFSSDGHTLALPDDWIIHLYETATAKEEGRIVCGDSTDVSCLLFSRDGKYLLTAHKLNPFRSREQGTGENALRLWNRSNGREVRRFPVPGGDIRALAISSDGKTVAAAVHDTVLLWELASGAERGRFTGHREWIWSLAFSPDGRLLASGSLDYTACVWDVTGICTDGQWSVHSVEQDELQRLWTDLSDKDSVRAYRALWRLATAGPSAVAFLSQRIRPAPQVEEKRLSGLIADLDSDQFGMRERASVELQQLGEQAEAALRKALAANPSPEAARRLRSLLEQVESRTLSPEQLHTLRAVEVLEHIGSSEARQLLQTLAEGAPQAILTREAKAALERLTQRSSTAP